MWAPGTATTTRTVAVVVVAAALTGGCGPVDRSVERPLVVDETPLGTSRAEVRRWHLDHDWCARRTWDASDEYETCVPRAYQGREDDRIVSLFRFEGEAMVAAAVYAPVPVTKAAPSNSLPYGVVTSLEGPPFVVFDDGLVPTPTEAGRTAALAVDLPSDQRRLLAAMRDEMVRRHGEPSWTSAEGTAMTWERPDDHVGLFLAADGLWTVETHQRPQPGPR